MTRVTVIFDPPGCSVTVPKGSTILSAIRAAEIPFGSVCGGKGECGKCRVIHRKGSVRYESDACNKLLTEKEQDLGYCLACATLVESDAEFVIPVESRIDLPRILVSDAMKPPALDPGAGKYLLRIEESGLPGHLSRSIRLEGYTGKKPGISPEILDELTHTGKTLTAVISRSGPRPELLAADPGDTCDAQYGIAIDLGTTTIAGLLVDLRNGEIIGKASVLNRQITYGEELISRITFAKETGGRELLRSVATECVNRTIAGLTVPGQVRTGDIIDLCVSGNTVMTWLFTGKDPGPLEEAGVVVDHSRSLARAGESGVSINPHAWVTSLPCVSRFVGGDAVGDVFISGMAENRDISLLIDLGTNGEIVLGNSEWLASTSCASGPAFEGGGLRCGIRAMHGAIEHVEIAPDTGVARVEIIGAGRPKGICGSGIIDTAAEMAAAGIIDFTGKIVEKAPFVRTGHDGHEYVLVPEAASGTGHDIVITARDMQYLMDSKAAVCGGIRVLLKKYRIRPEEVRNVYLAGAFGTYGRTQNLTRFGIIPEFPAAIFHALGNGSLAGAYAALLSLKARGRMEEIASRMTYIDLLVDPDFVEEYSAALRIPG